MVKLKFNLFLAIFALGGGIERAYAEIYVQEPLMFSEALAIQFKEYERRKLEQLKLSGVSVPEFWQLHWEIDGISGTIAPGTISKELDSGAWKLHNLDEKICLRKEAQVPEKKLCWNRQRDGLFAWDKVFWQEKLEDIFRQKVGAYEFWADFIFWYKNRELYFNQAVPKGFQEGLVETAMGAGDSLILIHKSYSTLPLDSTKRSAGPIRVDRQKFWAFMSALGRVYAYKSSKFKQPIFLINDYLFKDSYLLVPTQNQNEFRFYTFVAQGNLKSLEIEPESSHAKPRFNIPKSP